MTRINKHHLTSIVVLAVIVITSGCAPLPERALTPTSISIAPATSIPTLHATLEVSTETPAPTFPQTRADNTATPSPSPTPTITPSPTELPIETYIAYVQNDSILVTHVLSGKALETRETIKSPQSGGIMNLGWSPSGVYLSFTMLPDNLPHIYIINVKEGGKPIDLGNADLTFGNNWAWSPDSKLLAFEHEYELWVYSPANGTKKQLTKHLGTHWLWSLPVFTPDGKALWAVGTDSHNMDQNGNTRYKIYRIPLDGSGANAYPPGNLASVTEEFSGGLPLDLRFSPDGQKLAIITTETSDSCAKKAGFQVGSADGKDFRDFPMPSLAAMVSSSQNTFFYGDSLVWDPQSKGLWVNGVIRDCATNAIAAGEPQMSYVTLDGQEHEQIPGIFSHLSMDRTGALLGVVNAHDGPRVQILGKDGHIVLDLGVGDLAVLQP